MNCPYCGVVITPGQAVCGSCGRALPQSAPMQNTAPVPPVQNYNARPMPTPPSGYSPEYKPLSAWAYIGYNILFSIPIVGFILLIVYALDSGNINRRNYARSFLLIMLIVFILSLIGTIIAIVLGVSFSEVTSQFNT